MTTTRTSNPVTANAKHTELPLSTQRRILRGLKVRENANGLSLVDADDEEGARWWPTDRCDDQVALCLAYEAGLGAWHS